MEENLSEKARFFGLYLGQEILEDNRVFRFNGIEQSISSGEWYCLLMRKDKLTKMASISNCQLVLKPLSEITDEDLITLAQQEFPNDESTDWHIPIVGERLLAGMGLTNHFRGSGTQIAFKLFPKTDLWSNLRYAGFSLPFLGKDPVKEGWAIYPPFSGPEWDDYPQPERF